MFDFTTSMRLTSAWNEAVFRSLSSAAATLAALTEEAVNLWGGTVALAVGNGTLANSRTTAATFRALSRLPALSPVAAWPRLFGSTAWTSPLSGLRWSASLPVPEPWLGSDTVWRAFRPADWANVMSSAMSLATLVRCADTWLRPAVLVWPPQLLAQVPVYTVVPAPVLLPLAPPPAAFAAYRYDSGFAAAHMALRAQIAVAIAFLAAAWPLPYALAAGANPFVG